MRVVHVVLMAAFCTFNLQAQSPGGGRSGSVKAGYQFNTEIGQFSTTGDHWTESGAEETEGEKGTVTLSVGESAAKGTCGWAQAGDVF